ncbi:unnamed protein product [Symbiodinium natans]|uniref:Uncharacterized protein n=1 Tax=Symbiodinium natans TaxID=878477 RepID=A0A812UME4_9DINO|nr:unnamed protein product [Symbiodinium natans]
MALTARLHDDVKSAGELPENLSEADRAASKDCEKRLYDDRPNRTEEQEPEEVDDSDEAIATGLQFCRVGRSVGKSATGTYMRLEHPVCLSVNSA